MSPRRKGAAPELAKLLTLPAPARRGGGARLKPALRAKIGRRCWFVHPDTGVVIEGTYAKGRKVRQLTGIQGPGDTKPGESRTYNFEETVWTVPRTIAIDFGQPPANGGGVK